MRPFVPEPGDESKNGSSLDEIRVDDRVVALFTVPSCSIFCTFENAECDTPLQVCKVGRSMKTDAVSVDKYVL